MSGSDPLNRSLNTLCESLRAFIELSIREEDHAWSEWISSLTRDGIPIKCWEKKLCLDTDCPAYMNECRRCWLIAGTHCGGTIQGHFAKKYDSCTECDVYREAVYRDPVSELQEHIVALVHSLRARQQELRELAIRDSLTGLHNRHYFDLFVPREVEKARRNGDRITLLIIDINNFKFANDRYGHLYGDVILKEVATTLDRVVRSSEILIRYGGDEFLVVLSTDEPEEVQSFINRIGREIDTWNVMNGREDFELSLSIGTAVLSPTDELEEVLKIADRKMYEAKQRFRKEKRITSTGV